MKFFNRVVFVVFSVSLLFIGTSIAKKKETSLKERKTWSVEKLEEYQKTLKNENYFYGLGEILERAHELKNWDKVAHYAPLYLQEAEKNKKDWNYGNAIFYSNMALSEIAYNKGDKKLAREFLIKASETPGSPQLDSFGPFNSFLKDYLLKLAKNGEKESLIQFAKNCKNFVISKADEKLTDKEEKTDKQVTQWNLNSISRFIDQVQTGKTPDFKTPGI